MMKQKAGPIKAPAEEIQTEILRQARRLHQAKDKIRTVMECLHG